MYEMDSSTSTFCTSRVIATRNDPPATHRRARRVAALILKRDPHAAIKRTRFFVVVTGWVSPNRLVTALYYPRCTR